MQILETKQALAFHLQQQRLIELVRGGAIDQALEFAQEYLAPQGEDNPAFLQELGEPACLTCVYLRCLAATLWSRWVYSQQTARSDSAWRLQPDCALQARGTLLSLRGLMCVLLSKFCLALPVSEAVRRPFESSTHHQEQGQACLVSHARSVQ